MADAFEAHVGALYREVQQAMRDPLKGGQAYIRLQQWVRHVFSPSVFTYMTSHARRREEMIAESHHRRLQQAAALPPRTKGRPPLEGTVANQGRFGEPVG